MWQLPQTGLWLWLWRLWIWLWLWRLWVWLLPPIMLWRIWILSILLKSYPKDTVSEVIRRSFKLTKY
ncbi:KRTAP19-4 isoform 1 [Pongo abelii]|uniref:KRTAP19-4 isoform 1 n=1 Tax=Pongo abelii TaxID=9601 RepID=A0A2J8UKR1_PONAB|nr:KRTAP19-4 isoform 1 [Pongo abelii]